MLRGGAAIPGWGEHGADPPLGLLVAGHGAGRRHSGRCPRAAANGHDGPRAGRSSRHHGGGGGSSSGHGGALGGQRRLVGPSQGLGPGLRKRTPTGSRLLPACFLTQLVFRSQDLPLPRWCQQPRSRAPGPTSARGAKPPPTPPPRAAGKASEQGGCQHPAATPTCPLPPPQPPARGESSDACYFCGRRVYILERASAEGRFFHRGCFQCRRCGATLRLGDYAFDEEDGEAGFGARGCSRGKASPPCRSSHRFPPPTLAQVIFTARFTTPVPPAWTCPRTSSRRCPMG